MTVYEFLLEEVERGQNFNIDLKNKCLKIGKHKIISEGKFNENIELISNRNDAPWEILRELYREFKHSSPVKRKLGNNPYFKALPYEELEEYDLAFGTNRNLAQAKLEGYILLASMQGILTWRNPEQWFWRDNEDKDFIILKDWI